MKTDFVKTITDEVLELQDENGCWNVLCDGDKYFPELNYYVPNYKSTLWTLVLLADIKAEPMEERFKRSLRTITDHFLDESVGIFTIGKSHFPIPCLNGNMIYLHAYFRSGEWQMINRVIDFFATYQRFDDGDFVTPSAFPYCSNKSCYGKHTCYWGAVKLLKGLSFIPVERRTDNARSLMCRCVDFILLHEVCFSSHDKSQLMTNHIGNLTFPNMYKSDFLEILWLLKREGIESPNIVRALELLESKRGLNDSWAIEKPIKDLIVPIDKKHYGNELITDRAREVLGMDV